MGECGREKGKKGKEGCWKHCDMIEREEKICNVSLTLCMVFNVQ